MIEEKINEYGQKSFIENSDRIIKIGDKFLQVRLIETELFSDRFKKNPRKTKPMPRARFVNPSDVERIYYLVSRKDVLKKIRGEIVENEK